VYSLLLQRVCVYKYSVFSLVSVLTAVADHITLPLVVKGISGVYTTLKLTTVHLRVVQIPLVLRRNSAVWLYLSARRTISGTARRTISGTHSKWYAQ
jgi:hypothetical protein